MGLIALENTGKADISVMPCDKRGPCLLGEEGNGATLRRLAMSGLGRDETPLGIETVAAAQGEMGTK
jgi:hypothetical protein